MIEYSYKERMKAQFASCAAEAFRELYPDQFAEVGESQLFSADQISEYIEAPKDPRMGRFALPVFRFSKLLKSKPPDIASKAAEAIAGRLPADMTCNATGGFLNVAVDFASESAETIGSVLSEGKSFGN